MEFAIDVLSWILLVSGSFFAIVGGIGIVRMPEFFSRLHGGGITDTLGAALIILGLFLQAIPVGATAGSELSSGWLVAIKLMMILFFLLLTSPASCHALAKSGLSQGIKPVLDSKNGLKNDSKNRPNKTGSKKGSAS